MVCFDCVNVLLPLSQVALLSERACAAQQPPPLDEDIFGAATSPGMINLASPEKPPQQQAYGFYGAPSPQQQQDKPSSQQGSKEGAPVTASRTSHCFKQKSLFF